MASVYLGAHLAQGLNYSTHVAFVQRLVAANNREPTHGCAPPGQEPHAGAGVANVDNRIWFPELRTSAFNDNGTVGLVVN